MPLHRHQLLQLLYSQSIEARYLQQSRPADLRTAASFQLRLRWLFALWKWSTHYIVGKLTRGRHCRHSQEAAGAAAAVAAAQAAGGADEGVSNC